MSRKTKGSQGRRGRPCGKKVFGKMIYMTVASDKRLDAIASTLKMSRSGVVNMLIEQCNLIDDRESEEGHDRIEQFSLLEIK